MPAWPASLPRSPEPGSYDESPLANVIRTDMEAGIPKQRRRFTAEVISTPIAWKFNSSQLDDFIAFWREVLQSGALEFQGPHPRTNATVRMRFMASEGYHITDAGSPDMKRVTAKIEILPT